MEGRKKGDRGERREGGGEEWRAGEKEGRGVGVLLCFVLLCCVVWRGVMRCSEDWCGVWCSVVVCCVVWRDVVWCGAVLWYGVVLSGVVCCGMVWCGVVLCGGVWCGVVWLV